MSPRRAPAAQAVDEDLQCLLCGDAVEPFWHPTLEETVAYELCPRCAQAFAAAAERVAARIITPPAHNYADAHCGLGTVRHEQEDDERLRQIERRDGRAVAGSELRAVVEEERHVGADLGRDRVQLLH